MVFESVGNILNVIFSPILDPLLHLPVWLSLLIVSLFIALVSTLAYKFVTDQTLMKRLKSELKELQAEMKTLRDNPAAMMKVQKQVMETNMKYMTQSLKPTLVTFIPLILIFTWLSGHLAYDPLQSQVPFEVTAVLEGQIGEEASISVPNGITLISEQNQTINAQEVHWRMQGEEGKYDLTLHIGGNTYLQEVIISNTRGEYVTPEQRINDGVVSAITLNNEKTTPFGNFSLFGYHPGWLFTYILFSIVFSIGLRRVFKLA